MTACKQTFKVLVALMAFGALSACSNAPQVGDSGTSSPLALRSVDDSTTSAAAAVRGTVRWIGGCIALEIEGDATFVTIVWLGDGRTSWDADSLSVTMQRGGSLDDLVATVGEVADLGGQIPTQEWHNIDWIDWEVTPGPECPRKVLVI